MICTGLPPTCKTFLIKFIKSCLLWVKNYNNALFWRVGVHLSVPAVPFCSLDFSPNSHPSWCPCALRYHCRWLIIPFYNIALVKYPWLFFWKVFNNKSIINNIGKRPVQPPLWSENVSTRTFLKSKTLLQINVRSFGFLPWHNFLFIGNSYCTFAVHFFLF